MGEVTNSPTMSESHEPPPRPPDDENPTPQDGLSEPPPLAPTPKEPRSPTLGLPPISSSVMSPSENVASLSPTSTDRVFPIRSVVSVDPTPTPTSRAQQDYFHPYSRIGDMRLPPDIRRQSLSSTASQSSHASHRGYSARASVGQSHDSDGMPPIQSGDIRDNVRGDSKLAPPRLPSQLFNDIVSARSGDGDFSNPPSVYADKLPTTGAASSIRSVSSSIGDMRHVTHRFTHVMTEGGHAVITGRDGETLQRCEDEPIHIPGAVQGFGLLVVLADTGESGVLPVRIVSENSKRIIGKSPRELFAMDSFTDLFSEEQADNLIDHIDFIKDEDTDVALNGPEVFTLSLKMGPGRPRKLWCAVHQNDANPGLIICEFEMEDDQLYPLVPSNELTPELPEDTLSSNPTIAEFLESTENKSKPLRVLRSARKRKGEAAAMEVFNIMSQVQEQLAAAPSLDTFLKVLVGVVKELTGFHRVMMYQFDQNFNGRVVTELVDPRATKDLYKGLNFPASDIPKQARELYKLNRVRMLYDRDLETSRLVGRTAADLENPLDLTHSYLRAMSPIHIKYLTNMAVRSSMSISINAFGELWGLVACHSYGVKGMRVSFPIRKMCRLIGDSASRNIERLSYASRLQARKLINTVPTSSNPSGYIVASSDDLLQLFNADYGLLSIRDETKILGQLEYPQEALAMLEYLRMRRIESVMTSTDITEDFTDLRYPPGFQVIAGMLVVPLSAAGADFIAFFRKGQLREVKWAGNPYEKFVKEGTEGYLEPRKSFKTWSEQVIGKCREWTEEEIETAAVLCLVYGKFIEVWRQKEAALQNSQLTKLLLANSAHEVRTPLNAIINYLEIALEGSLDQETRENLSRSHSASKSLIYVINDLLDLTKTEEGGSLIKGDTFDLRSTLKEATDMFRGDAKRKNISYEIIEHPGLPDKCIGDQRRVRQAISNVTANAIQNTTEGGVKVEMYVASTPSPDSVEIEICVTDTGVGMTSATQDQLFYGLEQVQSELIENLDESDEPGQDASSKSDKKHLGLGLALVARIIKNMNGQIRLKSEEGKGSRFVLQFPFDLPDFHTVPASSPDGVDISLPETPGSIPVEGERTLVAPHLSRSFSGENEVTRKNSMESIGSLRSRRSVTGSLKSQQSAKSTGSDIDKLIGAIQETHLSEKGRRSGSCHSIRPSLSKRTSMDSETPSSPHKIRAKTWEPVSDQTVAPPHQRTMEQSSPGEQHVSSSGIPLRALKMPEAYDVPLPAAHTKGDILGELHDTPDQPTSPNPLSPNKMRVLVAEDDPLNSRIIKKRLDKLGHNVTLTVNGEDCATAFGERFQDFDVVLMDMQMPIVDGLTSTKMIRSFEKTHPGSLSTRAAFYGRIPIIAVSASLLEKNRTMYVDAGFDAWILKPISFDRLGTLLTAIVDLKVREACLYKPGEWENGGWFHSESKSATEASTMPSDQPPQAHLSKIVQSTNDSDSPKADGETGTIPDEQARLLHEQEKGKGKHVQYEGSNAEPIPETRTDPHLEPDQKP